MSPSPIAAARNSYAAALIASITYGAYVIIFVHCLHRLLCGPSNRSTVGFKVLLGYTLLLFLIQTVYFIAGCKWSAIEFVDSQVDPAVFAGELSSHLALLKDVTYTINIWLADSFILYRAFIIWGLNVVFAVPALLYLGSLATGIGLLVETAKPGAVFGQAAVINFGTLFWSLSVATNVVSTTLIAGRLLFYRRALSRALSARRSSRGRQNGDTASVAILVESAALYSVCAVVYIPLFAVNIPVQYPFSALLGGITSIAPTLIILRMAAGKAVKKNWSDIPLNDVVRNDVSRHTTASAHSLDSGMKAGSTKD